MGPANSTVLNRTNAEICIITFGNAELLYKTYVNMYIVEPGQSVKVESAPDAYGLKIGVVVRVKPSSRAGKGGDLHFRKWKCKNESVLSIEEFDDTVTGVGEHTELLGEGKLREGDEVPFCMAKRTLKPEHILPAVPNKEPKSEAAAEEAAAVAENDSNTKVEPVLVTPARPAGADENFYHRPARPADEVFSADTTPLNPQAPFGAPVSIDQVKFTASPPGNRHHTSSVGTLGELDELEQKLIMNLSEPSRQELEAQAAELGLGLRMGSAESDENSTTKTKDKALHGSPDNNGTAEDGEQSPQPLTDVADGEDTSELSSPTSSHSGMPPKRPSQVKRSKSKTMGDKRRSTVKKVETIEPVGCTCAIS